MTKMMSDAPAVDLVGFGRRLRIARAAAGLTQTELGTRVNRTRATIANIEAGRATTSLDQVGALCKALGVAVDWLLLGNGATTGDVPVEFLLRVRRVRDSWQRILDGNRALGWPEQATCVEMPRTFVADLDRLLAADGPRCRYCGADCSVNRSWDGGNLYACGPCGDDRAARRGRFALDSAEPTPHRSGTE